MPDYFIETGIYFNDYGESYKIKGQRPPTSSSNALYLIQIPFRLKTKLNLIQDKLSLTSTLGYSLTVNTEPGSSGSGHRFQITDGEMYNDSTRSAHINWYTNERFIHLFEAGLSLDYAFKNGLTFYISANLFSGFKKIVEMDVEYWINDGPMQSGTVFSKGAYFSTLLGIRYPISKFWQKKKNEPDRRGL